jgi:cytochrome c-type biogenesis protein CcmH
MTTSKVAAGAALGVGGLLIAGAVWVMARPLSADLSSGEAAAAPQLDAGAATSSIDAMERRLARSSSTQAGDWELLARSYAALGRWREADRAYDKASALAPANAKMLAERAVAILASREATAPDRAASLIVAALALEPLQPTALALALDPALRGAPAR